MKDFELVYNTIEEKRVKLAQHKPIVIVVQGEKFTSKTLVDILSKLKYLRKHCFRLKKKVIIDLGQIIFSDKITYLLLDMLLYDLLINTNFIVEIKISIDFKYIFNQGIKSTAFYRTIAKYGSYLDKEFFLNEYQKKIEVSRNYYRRYVTRESFEKGKDLQSEISSDIFFFMKQHFIDDQWIEDVCEVIDELIDNTYSHTQSDCLIDMDVCNANDDNGNSYKILNIGIINISENRIFDQIQENIVQMKYLENDELYRDIYAAYEHHKKFFDDQYQEEDFFQITAFQEGVTSRDTVSGAGGKGLTALIRNIIGKTRDSYSYVLSGRNILFFTDGYMEIDKSGHIGFNKTADYFGNQPALEVINKSDLYVPGTVFHLSLVRNSEVNNGKEN